MPTETRSMAKEQKLQRLMIEVKDYEAQVDRLVDERNNLECDMRMLKSSKDTINLKLTNAYCLLEESKADIDHKQALIDILRAEISKLQVTSDRVELLEQQLREALSSLNILQNEKQNTAIIQSQSLHNELSFALQEELSFANVTSDQRFTQWTAQTSTINVHNHPRPKRSQQIKAKLLRALNANRLLRRQHKNKYKKQNSQLKRVVLYQEIDSLKAAYSALSEQHEEAMTKLSQQSSTFAPPTNKNLIKQKCNEIMALLQDDTDKKHLSLLSDTGDPSEFSSNDSGSPKTKKKRNRHSSMKKKTVKEHQAVLIPQHCSHQSARCPPTPQEVDPQWGCGTVYCQQSQRGQHATMDLEPSTPKSRVEQSGSAAQGLHSLDASALTTPPRAPLDVPSASQPCAPRPPPCASQPCAPHAPLCAPRLSLCAPRPTLCAPHAPPRAPHASPCAQPPSCAWSGLLTPRVAGQGAQGAPLALHTSTPTPSTRTQHVQQLPKPVDTNLAKTVIFSDRIGKGLGYLLHNQLNQVVENVCLPQASFEQITNRMLNYNFSENTTVVLLLSHSSGVDKRAFISSMELAPQVVPPLNVRC